MSDTPQRETETYSPVAQEPSRFLRLTQRMRWWFRDAQENRKRHKAIMAALPILRHGTEQQLRDLNAPRPRTEADLGRIIRALAHREHDYGTCVYAMSISAEAAYNYQAHVQGVSGFQASCADMDFLKRTRNIKNGFQLINYDKLLYPQYDGPEHFPTRHQLIDQNIDRLGKAAEELLIDNHSAHPDVKRWWEYLVDMRRAGQQTAERKP